MPSLLTAHGSTAQNTILAEMVVMGVIVSVDELSATAPKNGGYIQIWIGTGIATGILVLISYVLPGFAIGISTAALLAVLLSKGSLFWSVLQKASGAKAVASTNPPATTATSQAPNTTTAGGRG